MKWIRISIDTTTAAVDFISEMLSELGVEGIEIEDNVPLTEAETKGMFIDILPELAPDEGKAKVSCYLETDVDVDALTEQIRQGLSETAMFVDIGSGEITLSETEDKDWINNWKQFFKPFCVDEILIKPTWEEIPEEHKDKMMIEIDPGTAFGTGSHETTRLCIRQIQKYMKPGDRVMDIGTGSGILSIAAMKLGADSVFATDVDEFAVEAAKENVAVNRIPEEKIRMLTGDIIGDEAIQKEAGYECYDFAVANILAPIIILLQGEIGRHLKSGSYFVTSGIINMKEEEVKAAFAANPEFEVVDTMYDNDWVSIVARKR
ncbi:MAG: 50S ribosomal protein L11 methyltransferase [Lachnospiraceae bacterium]|nr:50S ribosomal protein L11 methyltransferase [Lachnospiraceae bacterium]